MENSLTFPMWKKKTYPCVSEFNIMKEIREGMFTYKTFISHGVIQ